MDATLRRAAILQGTDRGAARALARRLTRTDFPSGHTIFAEGQPGDRLYIVVSGKVKITCRAGTGREAVLAVMGPSDMFGELSVFDPGPRTSSAVTLTKVRTMTMDRATFRWWIAEAPQVRERLLAVLSRRLRRTNDDLCALVFTDVSGRVARQLLDLGARFGVPDPHGLRVNHDLTQENFAALVGSTRPSVNRALTDFAHRGWIEIGDRSVIIVDAEQLARRAQ